MIKKVILLSSAFLFVLASCKTSTPVIGGTSTSKDTIEDYTFRRITRDRELFAATKELVPFDTVYLSKDTLHILTKKIIGCNANDFKLFWNGAIQKSLPPQATVKLFQQVNGECNQQHYFHLTYDMAPLHMKHDTASFTLDSCAAKTTLIRIGGYKHNLSCEY